MSTNYRSPAEVFDLAGRVVVLESGRVVAAGAWRDLEPDHGHLFAT